jgi:hypothetical protein
VPDVEVFRRARPTADPDRSVVELAVSDTGLAFGPAEVAELLAAVLAAAPGAVAGVPRAGAGPNGSLP